MNKAAILVIDDEPQIRKLLRISLESNGYKVLLAADGKEGLMLAASHRPDLILLDIGLPDMNGQEVLMELTGWYTRPVIMLSVRDAERDIVTALDHGALDYITKPFRTGELLARIRAAIRRSQVEDSSPVIRTGQLEIDLAGRVLRKEGEVIKLTATEFNLLALLVRNTDKVLTHQYILKEIWGVGYQTETQYLRVFMNTLRKKLEEQPNHPKYIITESGIGYRFQGS